MRVYVEESKNPLNITYIIGKTWGDFFKAYKFGMILKLIGANFNVFYPPNVFIIGGSHL
jgi:hypothetical protein